MLLYKFIIFSDHVIKNLYIFKSHQPKMRYAIGLHFSSWLSFHFLPSYFLNIYFLLTFTFCGLMNYIDDLRFVMKQRFVGGSIPFLKIIKVII